MSQENVDLIRSLYPAEGIEMVEMVTALEDADVRRNWASLLHPDFEMATDPHQPGFAGTVRGLDAFARSWQDWLSAFRSYRVTAKEFLELADGRVLVLVENRARSKTEDVEMAFAGGAIWTLEDGRIRRVEQFADRDRALEAAGLSD